MCCTQKKPSQAGLSPRSRESSFVMPPSVRLGKQLILTRLLRAVQQRAAAVGRVWALLTGKDN